MPADVYAASAHCQRCEWTAAGVPEAVDKAAEKHTRQAGHPTAVVTIPREKPEEAR